MAWIGCGVLNFIIIVGCLSYKKNNNISKSQLFLTLVSSKKGSTKYTQWNVVNVQLCALCAAFVSFVKIGRFR